MAKQQKNISPEDLKRYIPLNTLTEAGMAQLLPQVELLSAKKGVYLFKRGDETKQHYYLASGKVIMTADDGEDLIEADSNRAKFPLAHQFPRKMSACAMTDIQYFRIESAKLGSALSSSTSDEYEVNEVEEDEDDDWMSQLLRSRIFQMIPPGNIQRVMMCMEEQPVVAGDVIIRQGDEGDYFYLINKGHCSVVRDMGKDKAPIELAKLGPGASIGEDALLSGKKRSATVTMLEDGRLLRLSKDNFIELIKEPISNPFGFADAKAEVAKGAVWLDVREPRDFERGHLPDAVNIPFTLLRFQVGRVEELDTETPYVICCQDGRTSHAAAYFMTDQGFRVTVLDKGLQVLPVSELVREDGTPSIVTNEAEFEASLDKMDLPEPVPEPVSEKETKKEAKKGGKKGESTASDQQTPAMVAKLKQYIMLLDKERKSLEEKRIAEVSVLTETLDQLRQEHTQSVAELLELRRSSEEEIQALKDQLAKGDGGQSGEGDEALKEQVKGYLEEIEALKAEAQGAGKGNADAKALRDEVKRMKKELAQAEMALDAEISSRQEMEEALKALKATMEQ